MKANEIRMDSIYVTIEPLEEEVFAYVRGWKGGEVGFSVLDTASRHPDFSECGVFWVRPEDFVKVFEEYRS